MRGRFEGHHSLQGTLGAHALTEGGGEHEHGEGSVPVTPVGCSQGFMSGAIQQAVTSLQALSHIPSHLAPATSSSYMVGEGGQCCEGGHGESTPRPIGLQSRVASYPAAQVHIA